MKRGHLLCSADVFLTGQKPQILAYLAGTVEGRQPDAPMCRASIILSHQRQLFFPIVL
jgi:hypothetical protein